MPETYGDEQEQDPAVQAERTISIAADTGRSPEAEGKLLELSKQTGVDMATLRLQAQPRLDNLSYKPTRDAVFKRNSDIAEWMVNNPLAASMSADDTTGLENIKKNMAHWVQNRSDQNAFAADEAAQNSFGKRALATGGSLARSVSTSLVGASGQLLYGGLEFGADLFGAEGVADYAARKFEVSQHLDTHLATAIMGGDFETNQASSDRITQLNYLNLKNVGGPDISAEDFISGLLSTGPVAAAGAGVKALSVALKSPKMLKLVWPSVLAASGAQTLGSSYGSLRQRGDTVGEAGSVAFEEALVTMALTHFVPGIERSLERQLLGSADRTATTRAAFARAIGPTAAGEFTEEFFDQFNQTFMTESTDKQDPKSIPDILLHSVREGFKAGLIGAASGATIGLGEARHAAHVQDAINFADNNAKLAASLDSSAMASRSPTMAQDFLFHQGMKPDSAIHLTGADAKTLLSGGAEQSRVLETLGITPEAVEAARTRSGSLAIPAAQVFTTDAALRQQILDLGRKSPSSMNKIEADKAHQEMEAQQADQKVQKDERTQFAKDFQKEQKRIIKDFTTLTGEDEKTVRKLHEPLFAMAKNLYLTDPQAARGVVDMLKAWKPNKSGLTQQQIMQQITDLAGPDGKTALARVAFQNIGQASGRLDVLTGQLAVNPAALPDSISVAKLLHEVKVAKLDVAGRTVQVADQTGKMVSVDAEAAVTALRQRVESARRLADCL